MEQLQIAYLPRRGTEERWRRLWQEVAELCPEQFAAACQQAGITRVAGPTHATAPQRTPPGQRTNAGAAADP